MKYVQLTIIGVILGLSACAWLYVFNPSRLRQEASQVQATPSATPVATLRPSPSETPAVAGLANVNILLYGINMTVSDPISDVVYGEVNYDGTMAAGLTTQSLLAKYPGCTAGALGYLVRSKAPAVPTPSPKPTPSQSYYSSSTTSNQAFKKTIGGYTYSYKNSYYNCATDQSGRDTVAEDKLALQNSALPSLSATPVVATPTSTAKPTP